MPREKTYLIFDSNIGNNKPESIINTETKCPFCHREQLVDIIDQDGSIIFIKNKYPVLLYTLQTVIIETDECNAELSTYSKEHLYKVLHFAINKWRKMMESREFKSVLFYKNHGPYSGGTIRHPHMQIVGLKHIDYTPNIDVESFEGNIIDQNHGVELNLSHQPKNGFFEFNIRLSNFEPINQMADYIQLVTHYLLNNFHKSCKSYNLFFYYINNEIVVKVVPRFVTSPLLIGYSIPQISSRAGEVVREVQELYLRKRFR